MTLAHNASDAAVKAAVLEELSWEPSVAAAHIGVTARAGVVTLTGNVRSYAEKHAAERAAQRVKGVKAVAEEVEVRLPFEFRRRDEEIAAAAVGQLAWDAMVPSDLIGVKVEEGVVTLTGEVEWHFQKEAAEGDVRRLVGVTHVNNMLTIKPQVNALTISDDIQHALHRSWFFDPELVQVSARNGKVELTGSVRSLHDRQIAASTAWSARGATWVENKITVN